MSAPFYEASFLLRFKRWARDELDNIFSQRICKFWNFYFHHSSGCLMSMRAWLARRLCSRLFIIDCFKVDHAFALIDTNDFHLIWSASIQKLLIADGSKLTGLSFYKSWRFVNIWAQSFSVKVSEVFKSQLGIHVQNKSFGLLSEGKLGWLAGHTAERVWHWNFYLFFHWFIVTNFLAFVMMGGMYISIFMLLLTHFLWNFFVVD